ncbi:MAG: nitroreductase [Thermodesulfobacteriota bacterium]|nr:nitroreductase [Thermodesulfobacteriota bacterium]
MLKVIKGRRSIRRFTCEAVDEDLVNTIIEMGTWAPSGLNNQPWRFVIIQNRDILDEMSRQTKYSHIIENAPICISVFLDISESYDRVKDIQAIGACIQNMLLTIHHIGLGGVWLGEILKNREQVEAILEVPENLELMAVIALGRPAESKGSGRRKPIDQVVIARK